MIRKPPDATALFLADIRREIRRRERLIEDAVELGMAGEFTDRDKWLGRAKLAMEAGEAPTSNGAPLTEAAAIEACAALFFAARGAEKGGAE